MNDEKWPRGNVGDVESIGGTVRIYSDGGLNTSLWVDVPDKTDLAIMDKLLSDFRNVKDTINTDSPSFKEGLNFQPKGETRDFYALKSNCLYLVAYDNRDERGGYAWYVNFYKAK